MLGNLVKSEVETFYSQLKTDSLFFRATEQGQVSEATLSLFISNLHYLVSHTPLHLQLAKRISTDRGHHKLATYFSQKIEEETGHDQWAATDLVSLKSTLPPSSQITGAMLSLVDTVESLIRRSPYLYLPYIFQAEYLTVIGAPEWFELLESRCHIDRSKVSIVANHAELDKHHAAEGVDFLNQELAQGASPDEVRTVLAETLNLYKNFLNEVIHATCARTTRTAKTPPPAA